jgi:hypothetical protein
VIPPAGDVDAEPFWAAVADGTLLVSMCEACGHRWLPPLATCPRCASRTVTSTKAAATGALYSWTVIHRAADPAYADDTPYTVGLVELTDGARLYGRVVGVAHDDLRADLPVAVRVRRVDDQPVWEFVAA